MKGKYRIGEKFKYIFNMIIALMLNILLWNYKKKNIWILGAGDDRYENNMKGFAEYLKQKNNIKLYWIVSPNKIKELHQRNIGIKLVKRGGFKNYLLALNAKVAICSHSDFDVAPGIFRIVKGKTKLVNINHGFDGIKICNYNNQKIIYNIIIAASEYEKSFKINNYNMESDRIIVTGFARFDYFHIRNTPIKIRKILIMPTWRDWYQEKTDHFSETQVFKEYMKLIKLIREYWKDKLIINLFLHPYIEKLYKNEIIFEDEDFNYIREKDSIQGYINEADILITDYSSLSWDFMYMNKPVIYFWFDYEEYNSKRGLYVKKSSFNYVATTPLQVVQTMNHLISENIWYNQDKKKYFDYLDKNNCKRIYETICKWKIEN